MEFKKSQTLPDDKYNVVNELVDLRAKHAQSMDKINKLQTYIIMDDMKLTCQHEIDTLNGKLRLWEILGIHLFTVVLH